MEVCLILVFKVFSFNSECQTLYFKICFDTYHLMLTLILVGYSFFSMESNDKVKLITGFEDSLYNQQCLNIKRCFHIPKMPSFMDDFCIAFLDIFWDLVASFISSDKQKTLEILYSLVFFYFVYHDSIHSFLILGE